MLKQIFIAAAVMSCAVLFGATHPDAGAKAVLKKYADSGKNYTQRTGRTAIFARAQIKYGLERDDYLRRWTDRPLWQDTALQQKSDGSYINPEAWKITHRTIRRYGIDGWAFFPISTGRSALFDTAATPGYEMTVLPEFILNAAPEQNFPIVERMLKSAQVYRFNGKFVITTYSGTDDPAYWMNLKKVLTAKYGDKFLFLPMHNLPRRLTGYGNKNRVLTADGVHELADIIRKWLRCVDGYYYNNPALNEFRRYDAVFDREVMIPLLHGILSEPEFKDKLLAWGTKSGHENFYEKGSFTYNCGGTSMLRGSVGSAVEAKADIINLVEWDEENENTHFRPTLANGFATKRIIRYFAEKAGNKVLPPLEGDDLSIPDVILSYRRVLAAGETLTCEVVNVPGAGSKPGSIDVVLALKNISGEIVRTFKGKLDRMKLDELRFDVPVADVLDSHLLIPELILDGRKFAAGFTPVELRANYNGDNKWFKHPVRDLAKCRTDLQVTPLADGKVRIDGRIVSETPLHQVALLDSGAEIWMDNVPAEFQESAGRVVFQVLLRFKPKAKLTLDGDVRVINGGKLYKFSSGCDVPACMKPLADGWHLQGRCARFGNLKHMVFSIERSALDKAEIVAKLKIAAPGKAPEKIFDIKLPVKELVAKGLYALTGKYMSNMVFHHSDHPVDIPPGSGKKEVTFSVVTAPGLPQSAFYIEALDVERKSYRSQPVTIYRRSGKKAEFSAYDFFGKKAIRVKCDEALLTPQKFIISPEYGAAVKNTAGNMLNGLAGGQASLVNNLRFMGESGYGSLVMGYQMRQANELNPAPAVVTDAAGNHVWRFNGKQGVSFPVCTIYPYCGFEIKVRFTPSRVNRTRTLISCGHAGVRLLLKHGVPYAEFFRASAPQVKVYGSGKVEAGKTSEVILRFDQKNLQIITNGVAGKAVPCTGNQLYPKAVSVGLDPSGWGFCGDISSCEIRPL